MRLCLPLRTLTVMAAASFATALALGDADTLPSQRIRDLGTRFSAEYSFTDFSHNQDQVSFSIDKKTFSAYNKGFGYRKADLNAITTWLNNARQSIYNIGAKEGRSQAQINSALNNIQNQYNQKISDYLASRGFKILSGNTIEVDVAGIVRKNAPILKPLALAFEQIAVANSYSASDIIGAVTSMAQTAIIYKEPPQYVGDLDIAGFLPPMTSIIDGWGDCDTKTGVIASILANWPQSRMVGVRLPDHYLMGVLRNPNQDDLFVEYGGLKYVLIESAGPAWLPPGMVGDNTLTMLQNRQDLDALRIEPFF